MMDETSSCSEATRSFKWVPRYSIKRLLIFTGVSAVLLGVVFGPRRYVARVQCAYGQPYRTTGAVHPRFLKYEAENLSDAELLAAEEEWILSPGVIQMAIRELIMNDVDLEPLGNDPVKWFRERVEFHPLESNPACVEVTLSHRQPDYMDGWELRNTLAFQALTALLGAYRTNCITGHVASVDEGGYRIPKFSAYDIERRLW